MFPISGGGDSVCSEFRQRCLVICACALLVGCQTVPDTPQEQTTLRQQADYTLEKAGKNPDVASFVTKFRRVCRVPHRR